MLQRKYPQASIEEIMQKYLEHIKKQFDSSGTMSTVSYSSMKDVQDPNEDMDYTVLWEAVTGGNNLMTENLRTTDVTSKGKEIDQ